MNDFSQFFRKNTDLGGNISIVLDFIKRILRIWLNCSYEHLRMTKLSAAMTNTVYIIKNDHPHVEMKEPLHLLLRIYGTGVDFILDRSDELDWFVKLSRAGAGPKLLATFANGRFEEYIDSLTFTPLMMRQPRLIESEPSSDLSMALAKFHTLNVEREAGSLLWKRIDSWRREASFAFESLIEKYQAFDSRNSEKLSILFQIGSHQIFDEEEFSAEGKFGRFFEYLKRFDSPIVPCHNDLQHGNILLDRSTSAVVFIDYEYSGMNYAAYDIANHFCEWASDFTEANPNPHIMDFEEKYPSILERRCFIEKYLEYSGFTGSVDRWMEAVEGFKEISHLLWAYWGVIQAKNSTIDFDYLGYSLMRLEALRIPLFFYC